MNIQIIKKSIILHQLYASNVPQYFIPTSVTDIPANLNFGIRMTDLVVLSITSKSI
jgi:hypothetical protein